MYFSFMVPCKINLIISAPHMGNSFSTIIFQDDLDASVKPYTHLESFQSLPLSFWTLSSCNKLTGLSILLWIKVVWISQKLQNYPFEVIITKTALKPCLEQVKELVLINPATSSWDLLAKNCTFTTLST